MNLKNLIAFLVCLGLTNNIEAQFLKKLKKKAEEAAERTILRKTDEVVSTKTENAIDDVTTPNPDKTKEDKAAEIPKSQEVQKSTSETIQKPVEADLHLQASVQPESTQLGGSVTFKFAVNNKGPETARHIVSKIHIPKSYSITNISVSQGKYNKASEIWTVGDLEAWKRAEMTVVVVVVDGSDLMTMGEVIACAIKDPDSTPNNGIDTNGNGLIIDDRDDEDDGDGQDVKLGEVITNNTFENSGVDVKMVMEHKKDKIISYLDFDTMAMRMEYHSKGKNPDPVYWDKDGYIYAGEKGSYYKIPFDEVKNMGKNIVNMFSKGSEGMGMVLPKVGGKEVSLEWPNEPIMYNGYEVHVYINRYPMIEWTFVYHPKIFKGADNVKEERLDCRGNSGCTKFTLTEGEGAGSIVLFDSKDRLAEIRNPDGASAIYTYEPATVKLPLAQSFNFNFKN
jgi:hypothetical protein